MWEPLLDFLFCASSVLLAVFFGAALGNVVRGVPLDASGYFFEPLWTNFNFGDNAGILDWYTILVGVLALGALTMHGAAWVRMKTPGAVSERAAGVAGAAWWAVAVLTIVVSLVTFRVQPSVMREFRAMAVGNRIPAAGGGGNHCGVRFTLRAGPSGKRLSRRARIWRGC